MEKKPKCIIVTGRPASGKSGLAKQLAERLYLPLISRDAIKEGYVNTFGIAHNQLSPDTNRVVSEFFFDMVYQYLRAKVSIIIEAAFQHQVWESRMAQIERFSQPLMLICSVDDEVAARRFLQRRLTDPQRDFYHGDKRIADKLLADESPSMSEYVPPKFDLPTVEVSTIAGYAPDIEEIKSMILDLG